MFDAQPFSDQPQDELRYFKIVVAALRRLAIKESHRCEEIVGLALCLEEQYGSAGTPRPTRDELERAAATCWRHIVEFSQSIEAQDPNTEVLRTLATFNVGPNHASKPWLQEPEEFHPPFDPADYPRELAWHLEMLQRRTILVALLSALEPPALGLC